MHIKNTCACCGLREAEFMVQNWPDEGMVGVCAACHTFARKITTPKPIKRDVVNASIEMLAHAKECDCSMCHFLRVALDKGDDASKGVGQLETLTKLFNHVHISKITPYRSTSMGNVPNDMIRAELHIPLVHWKQLAKFINTEENEASPNKEEA